MASIPLSISMPEIFYKVAKEKSKISGSTFSGYITQLVAADNLEEIKKEYERLKNISRWEKYEKLKKEGHEEPS